MTSELYRRQVAAALAALTIESQDEFSWLGQRQLVGGADGSPAASARERLQEEIELRLYGDFYCRGRPAPPRPAPLRPLAARADFLDALSAANCGSGQWSKGWEIAAVGPEGVTVRRRGLQLLAPPARCRTAGGDTYRPDGEASVLLPKELLAASSGFYVALGDIETDEQGSRAMTRVYFSVRPRGAVELMACLTHELNAAGVPFQLKVLDDPLLYFRCDAGVLYVPRAAFPAVVEPLHTLVRRLGSSLRDRVPALTKRLGRGIAAAEGPSTESYGAHRCRLVAAALVETFVQGVDDVDERVGAVERAFVEAGLTLDAPYLESGGCDVYSL